jgi:hypothetical protein
MFPPLPDRRRKLSRIVFNRATAGSRVDHGSHRIRRSARRRAQAARRRIAVGRRPTFLLHDRQRRVHRRDHPGSRVDLGWAVRLASAHEARAGKAAATDADRQLEVMRGRSAADLQLVVRGRIRQARGGPRWPLVFDAPGELTELRLAHWPRCRGLTGLFGFSKRTIYRFGLKGSWGFG